MKKLLFRLAYQGYRFYLRITQPITLGVRTMLIKENQVVLVYHTYLDQWHFPGGLIEKREYPIDAAQREAAEEVGATLLTEPQLLGVYSNFREGRSDHTAVYYCTDFTLSGEQDRWEIERIELFALDGLPQDISPGTKRRIENYLEGNHPYSEEW